MLRIVVVAGSVSLIVASGGLVASQRASSTEAASRSTLVVADAYTSVVASVLSPSTFPFKGTDGKYHIAYELLILNASRVPAMLQKIEVVDAASQSRVIVSYSGEALISRLRGLAGESAIVDSAGIEPNGGRILYVDYAFDLLAEAPTFVLHHLSGLGASSPATQEPTAIDYVILPFNISAGTPQTIAPPLRGKGWVALNGCCEPGFPHRGSDSPFNGRIVNGQRFAIDWKRMDDAGAFYEGDKTKNESYVDYGADILAVADGTVIETLDGLNANDPGVLPAKDPVKAQSLTVQNVDGNHIVIDLGNGDYAFYAHLVKGSLKVKPGDKVKTGQVIASLGNTGNANASHLHFHLMDGPSVLASNGVPYVINKFEYDGQVLPQAIAGADDFLTGKFGQQRLTEPLPRADELPLAFAIVNFSD